MQRFQQGAQLGHSLAHPNVAYASGNAEPLIERHPLPVWKGIAFSMFLANLFLCT